MQPSAPPERWVCMMCPEDQSVPRQRAIERQATPVLENWLKTTLRQRFDHTLGEPLPAELAAIVASLPDERDRY